MKFDKIKTSFKVNATLDDFGIANLGVVEYLFNSHPFLVKPIMVLTKTLFLQYKI